MAFSKPVVPDSLEDEQLFVQHYLVCDNENCEKNCQFYCNPCHLQLCEQCGEEHQGNQDTKNHEVVPYLQHEHKLPVEKCKDHPTKDIDMFCEDCQIPACSKCVTQHHQKHALKDLETIYSEKFTLCLEKVFKIHQYFLPTSRNIQRDIKADSEDLKATMNKMRTSLRAEAETFKSLIDTVTSDNVEQVNELEQSLLEILQSQDKTYEDYISYLEGLVREVFNFISFKKVKDNPIIFSCFERVAIKPVPESTKPVHPVFAAGQYSKEDITKVLGRVTVPDTKPENRKIKPMEIVSAELKSTEEKRREEKRKSDVKETLSLPFSLTKIREYRVTGVSNVHHISFDKSGGFWFSEKNGYNIVQTDIQGKLLRKIKAISEFGFHTVNRDGDFIFTDRNNKVINMITPDNAITEYINTGDWKPISVHSSHINGDILVGMIKDEEAKVTRYNKEGIEIQNIQRDNNGQRLYGDPLYITENINSNICISDKRAVVVVNKSGQHRFSYTGQSLWSCLWGICTDKVGRIMVCDCPFLNSLITFFNSTIHLLDQEGQLLSLLLTPQHGINHPRCVFVDDENNLHVGQRFSNKVTVFQYLQ